MNFSKVITVVCTVLAVLGVIVIFGAVGQSDYMSEIGQVYPLKWTVFKIMLGVGMIVPESVRTWIEQQ